MTENNTPALTPEAIEELFNNHRTVNHFTHQEVTDEQLRHIYDLTKMGPTAYNAQTLRITFLRSEESRKRLIPALAEPNQAKTLAAPVTAILAYDTKWFEKFEQFNPRMAALAENFAHNDAAASAVGEASALIAIGYFITAIRTVGLAAGPMGGVNFETINQEFFPEGNQKALLVCNLGYGITPEYPRNPRFSFEEATDIL